MTIEQNEALCNLREKGMIYMSKQQAAHFFEQRLGKVNAHVIDFKKSLQSDLTEFSKAQSECERLGVIDILADDILNK
jgi:hypothetical protein